jgi:hypothetical protein
VDLDVPFRFEEKLDVGSIDRQFEPERSGRNPQDVHQSLDISVARGSSLYLARDRN